MTESSKEGCLNFYSTKISVNYIRYTSLSKGFSGYFIFTKATTKKAVLKNFTNRKTPLPEPLNKAAGLRHLRTSASVSTDDPADQKTISYRLNIKDLIDYKYNIFHI